MYEIVKQEKRKDVIWTEEHHQETFKKARLELVKIYRPLAKENDPYKWINEARIAPWVIYVLKRT